MPCLWQFSQKSSWQTPPSMLQPPWKYFLVCKIRILRNCPSNSPNTRFVNNARCFVRFEQVMCDADHVSVSMSHPPIWQRVPRIGTQWHRITVICKCFRETLCCQLGLGNWLASQYPNQVDSPQGVKKKCQPTTKSIIFGKISRVWPTRICKSRGLCMVLCTRCQAPCPTRQ